MTYDESSSITLCRFDDSPLELVNFHDDVGHRPQTCWDLEDCLEEHLDNDEQQQQEQQEQQEASQPPSMPPLCYQPRLDLGFLSCKRPIVTTKESILGLLEEDEGQPRDLPIQLHVWTAAASNSRKQKHRCSCPAPHHAWKRRVLEHIATPPPLPHQKPHHCHHSLKNESLSSPRTANSREIHWIDFRTLSSSSFDEHNQDKNTAILPTCATVTHFLRSLLGSSPTVSPWMNRMDHDNSMAASTATLSGSDCVIIVFSNPVPELTEFRVSDACPSWSLYAVARMQLDDNLSNREYIFPWNSIDNTRQESRLAHVLIYRKIPTRDRLSTLHPLTNAPATKACLWETQIIYPPADSNGDTATTATPFYEYRMVAPPYISPTDEYPSLKVLIQPDALARLQAEALRIPQWTAWPEQQHYQVKAKNGDGAPWHVFPLCYCFPAHDVTKRKWIPLTTSFCPDTVALLQQHLGDTLRTALFSRLDPQAVLEAHTGWQDLANHVYRVHLPLQVPEGGLCGTWVDGCVETHEVGRLQAFDDSKTHRAFNYSPTQDRVVLILDLERPADLPLGTAKGGHSDELDAFIEQMGGAQGY